MADRGDVIELCASAALCNGGPGVRFDVRADGNEASGFVVRYESIVHGYLNRCAHVAMELDWMPAVFFDFDARFLMCATHGAMYEPATGSCAGGPCAGHGGLVRLDVFEQEGRVYWRPDAGVRPKP